MLMRTTNHNFYLTVFNELKQTTNLTIIQKKLNISKQQLHYYLLELKKSGLIIKKARGWYEVVKKSKNSTKYENLLSKDSIRGHAYIWNAKIDNIPLRWSNRINILKKKKINFKLVGAKETTPRIKCLGRKIWLCNNHLRIYDRKDESYYEQNAIKSRYLAFCEIKLIVNALNNKLGLNIKPSDITFQREHYAIIKNDLAIEENRKGNIWKIEDDEGVWLLVDDSLGKGGELENIGKSALKTNVPMQKWWNDNKEHNFKVTPTFTLDSFNKTNLMIQEVTQNQMMFNKNFESHVEAIKTLSKTVKQLESSVINLKKEKNTLQNLSIERSVSYIR